MKIVLATSNKGKVKEIQKMCTQHEVIPYTDIIEGFEIIEDAPDFKGNALIKARAVFKALGDENALVLSDDSGISVEVLDGAPGIYSARYGGEDASDTDNLHKLMQAVKEKGVSSSKAHYTAAIAIVTCKDEFSVHGWMYGDVITEPRGDKGFGYDSMFIPSGYDKTLGELDMDVKQKLSHRAKALSLAKKIINTL